MLPVIKHFFVQFRTPSSIPISGFSSVKIRPGVSMTWGASVLFTATSACVHPVYLLAAEFMKKMVVATYITSSPPISSQNDGVAFVLSAFDFSELLSFS